jgi:hypothetical protein
LVADTWKVEVQLCFRIQNSLLLAVGRRDVAFYAPKDLKSFFNKSRLPKMNQWMEYK